MTGSVLDLAGSRQLPRLALIGAALLLLATVTWHLQRRLAYAPVESTTASTAEPTSAPAAAPDMAMLSTWQPYGSAPTTDAPAEPAVVAPSPLNIQLRGVVATEDGKAGEAIIADASGIERSYSIGETIADGAVLQSVNRRDIVIKRGDQLESVSMPEIPSAGGGEAPPLPEATNVPMTEAPATDAPPPEAPPPATEAAPPAAAMPPEGEPAAGTAPPAIPAPPPPGTPPPVEALPPGNQ